MKHQNLKYLFATLLFAFFIQQGYAVNTDVHHVTAPENIVSKKEQKAELKSEIKGLKKEWKQQRNDARKVKSSEGDPDSNRDKKKMKTWGWVLIIVLGLTLIGLILLAWALDAMGG